MHALIGMFLAVALQQGMRRRPSPPPEPQWVFWRLGLPVTLAGAMNGEMWFTAPGAGVVHEGGDAEVLDKNFSGTSKFFVPAENKLCAVRSALIHCVSRSGVIQDSPLPPGVDGTFTNAGPDGSLWFSEPTLRRIAVLRPGETLHEIAVPDSFLPVSGVTFDRDGEAWFGDIGRVVHLRRDDTFEIVADGAFAKQGWSPWPSPDGSIWIAVSNGGHRSNPNANAAMRRLTKDGTLATIGGLGATASYVGLGWGPGASLWVRIDSWDYPFYGLAYQHIWPDGLTFTIQSPPSPPATSEFASFQSAAVDASGRLWVCYKTLSGSAWIAKLANP